MIIKVKITHSYYIHNKEKVLNKIEYIKKKIYNNLNNNTIKINYSMEGDIKVRFFILVNNNFVITQDFPFNKEFDEDELIKEIKSKIIKKCLD